MNERSFISGLNNHLYIQNYNRELSDKKWQWWGKGVICDYDDDYLNWAAADSWGVSSKLYQNILSSSSVHILSLTLLLWWMICRGLSGTYSLLIGSHTIILFSHQGWSEFWPGGFNHLVKTGLNHLIKPTKTGQKWSKLKFH